MTNTCANAVTSPRMGRRARSHIFNKNRKTVYSRGYFKQQAVGSASSAGVVVPLVLSLLHVKSVIDVGCGTGSWAAEFEAHGVLDVCGIDGDYVDYSQLRIQPEQFIARDLLQPMRFDRTFDLALCLEVAEHLPKSRAQSLVADLTCLAPCLLFSAAIPGQGGVHHVNEQYLSYWVDLFKRQQYEAIDPIRPRILGNDSVDWFYQQNLIMFVAQGHPLLEHNFPEPQIFIHPFLYELIRQGTLPLRTLVRSFPGALYRSIQFHLGLS